MPMRFDTNIEREPWRSSEDPPELRCKQCGSTDVRWRRQNDRWVLFSLEPGKLHVCPIVDNFKPVPE